ncbi:MAG TPA: GNAT family N-acetyltransferase [Candidatus Sulfomarinibacteraceae bacterium]|nr:GNAT family N-acetyltransferase [Candidatus Sulfomarinibacteraceae bacterium]
MDGIRIVNLRPEDEALVQQVAALLLAGFRMHWPGAWPDMASALAEVRESFGEGRVSRAALDTDGQVLGWIGAIGEYDGHVWELHPLVVHGDYERRGIGRALVLDLEAQVARRGGLTLFLGTDDEDNMTSLGGVDLYPDPLAHLARLENRRGHPFEFYQKLGFSVVGVVPDANGRGKPDILMAKRVNGDSRAKR